MLRPSNAGRWVNCAASPRLEELYPDTENEDAKEGTAAHWVAAQVLSGEHTLDELTDRAAPNGVIVTGEMVEHVQTYIDVVPQPVIVERLLPSGILGVEDGTPDALRVDGRHGHIWDFKYGYGIVEAIGNLQGACYAVSLFSTHNWELDTVTFHIVQPRPYHVDGRVRSWTITRDEAERLCDKLLNGAADTSVPDPKATTGPHCKYCRALHTCESARRAGMNAVDVSYEAQAVDLTGDALASELRTLSRASDAIKLRLDAIQSHAMSLMQSGGVVPGWSLDRAYGKRRWTDPENIGLLEALSGTTLTESKPVTPAQAEKRGVHKKLVKQFTTTPETGHKLVERDGSTKAAQVFGTPPKEIGQ